MVLLVLLLPLLLLFLLLVLLFHLYNNILVLSRLWFGVLRS